MTDSIGAVSSLFSRPDSVGTCSVGKVSDGGVSVGTLSVGIACS